MQLILTVNDAHQVGLLSLCPDFSFCLLPVSGQFLGWLLWFVSLLLPFSLCMYFLWFFFCLIFFFFNINQCLHEKVQMTSGLSVLNSPFPASCTALPFSQGILADAMLGSPGCLWGQRSLFGAEPAGHSYSCHPRAAGASGFKLCKITTVPFWSWNLAQNRHVRGTEGEQPVLKRVCVFREYW